MRKLSSDELINGMFVQCREGDSVIYQILIKDGHYFYTIPGSGWEMEGDIVKSVWCETEETKALNKTLNRENKLNQLGI